jgi:hypothetical protein
VCSSYELTKQFMKICVKNCAIDLKKNNLYESHSFKITCTDNDQYLPTGGQEAYAMSDTVITESVGVSLSNGD